MLERLLVVGLGSIGRRHTRIARQLVPGLKIAALRRDASRDAGDVRPDVCVTEVGQALAFRPQAAVISNPATHHLEVAMELARAGVHMLVEKPISASSRGVAELIETCRLNEATLMVGYNLRFLPSLQRFRGLLADRKIGRVISARAEAGQFLPSWRPGVNYQDTVSSRAELGGGVLLELSHEIDYLRWLFGEVDWVSAYAGRQSDLRIDVEDTVHMTLGFAGDVNAPPGCAAPVVTLNLDFIRHDPTRTCVAIGDGGSLRWDGISGTVDFFTVGGAGWQSIYAQPPARDESYVAEWQHFLGCIANRSSALVSGEDGLGVLQVIEAARQSAAAGRTVSVLRAQARGYPAGEVP